MKRWSDRCYQKPGKFNIAKTFISVLISLLFYHEMTYGEFFSREDKDSRLTLTTFSFKCYTCYFKGSYGWLKSCLLWNNTEKERDLK